MDSTPPEQPKQIENVKKTNNEIEIFEPPLAPGMTRLYRAEDAGSARKIVWKDDQPVWEGSGGEPDIPLPSKFVETQGTWFSENRALSEENLLRIREFGTEPLPNAKLFYVDVPTGEAQSYRVSNLPSGHSARDLSYDHKNESILPRKLADRKQLMPQQLIDAGQVAARQRIAAQRAVRRFPGDVSAEMGALAKQAQATAAAPPPRLPVTEPGAGK